MDAKPKILIVDDEAGLRDMLTFELSQRWEVAGAGSGEEALEKTALDRFEVVLCDIMMPGIGGVETLKRIKERMPHAEVIMATGCATLETAIESMRCGAYDYVTKPYEIERLAVTLDRALERARLKGRVTDLQETDRVKSEFLASMSHELRTPLNSIIGYTELVIDGVYGPAPAAQAQALGRVTASARALLTLINDVLDLSKLNAGMMPVHPEDFELTELLEEVRQTLSVLAEEKGLSLRTQAAAGLRVRSDKSKLRQILINLAGNAVKFTEKGSIDICAVVTPDKRRLTLSVADTGAGISPEDQGKLFEQFRQLEGTLVRRHGGTGLGLSIVKKIAELMGGGVSVESVLGRGTTFRADVLVEQAQIVIPAGRSHAQNAGSKLVLIIEDDQTTLALLRDGLEAGGYATATAQSGEEGLALAKNLKPYAITLDIMMPRLDGWTILQSLKSNPETAAIPVLVVTSGENRELGYSLGVSDWLVKPVDYTLLIARLNALDAPKGRRIHVADDDPDVAEFMKIALTSEGYRVTCSGSGRRALASMRAEPPDLAFVDLGMPDMDGAKILEAMAAEPALSRVPVIVLTGRTLTRAEQAALETRAELVMQKGKAGVEEMLSAVRSRLAKMEEISHV
ncbi:MAG: response regulator [Elusimicrobia bacterium]|nr:response regulator [Elusimicrobiota bacterium]